MVIGIEVEMEMEILGMMGIELDLSLGGLWLLRA